MKKEEAKMKIKNNELKVVWIEKNYNNSIILYPVNSDQCMDRVWVGNRELYDRNTSHLARYGSWVPLCKILVCGADRRDTKCKKDFL